MNISKEQVNNSQLLVYLSYLRTEYSSQNTYYATMRFAFIFALIAASTKNYYILAFSIILLIGAYIQYSSMGNILIDINELARNPNNNMNYDNLYKLRDYNNYAIIFYTIIFLIAIFLQFYSKSKT